MASVMSVRLLTPFLEGSVTKDLHQGHKRKEWPLKASVQLSYPAAPIADAKTSEDGVCQKCNQVSMNS